MTHSTRQDSALWVGRPILRFEDSPLLTGQGTFTADVSASRYIKFVRSPVPAGKILNITAPPDAAVITADDLKNVKPICPILRIHNYIPVPQPLLASRCVRYVGELVAACLGTTPAEAEDIADRVNVEIEEMPAVVDARSALEPDAVSVHPEAPDNVIVEGRVHTGPFADQIAPGLHRILLEANSRRQAALPLEPRAAHAAFNSISKRVTLTCTTQSPHLFRTAIADLLGIREAELRVIAPHVGGGFGQKATLPPEFAIIVWLCRHFQTEVLWVEDRRENLVAGFHARDATLQVQGTFTDGGRLLDVSADVTVNVGAYSSFPTSFAVEPLMAMAEMPGVYDFQSYSCVSRGVVTNTCPMAPYRGVARPMIVFAMELMIDAAARQLKIEPAELRRRNLITTFPYKSATGLVFDEGSYVETLEMALREIDLPAFRRRQTEFRAAGKYLGLGLATFSERTGYGTSAYTARKMDMIMGWERAELVMDPSGAVEARVGVSPHGQGLQTTLAQIIADEIGCAPDQIRVITGDTDRTPYGWGTFASRSLVISGGACMLAARKIRKKIETIAAQLLEVSPSDILIERGHAKIMGTDRTLSFEEIARAAYHQTPRLVNLEPGINESATYDPAGTFSNACHAAIVEVDVETGAVQIDRYIVVEDAGRIINPMIVDGQIHGGVAQGIGNALFEEIVYDDTGNPLTATLADYLSPTSSEMPEIEIKHLETPSSSSVTGAKGLGEGGAIGPPAALLNAINDALSPFAVQLSEIPATPKKIRKALRAAAVSVP